MQWLVVSEKSWGIFRLLRLCVCVSIFMKTEVLFTDMVCRRTWCITRTYSKTTPFVRLRNHNGASYALRTTGSLHFAGVAPYISAWVMLKVSKISRWFSVKIFPTIDWFCLSCGHHLVHAVKVTRFFFFTRLHRSNTTKMCAIFFRGGGGSVSHASLYYIRQSLYELKVLGPPYVAKHSYTQETIIRQRLMAGRELCGAKIWDNGELM